MNRSLAGAPGWYELRYNGRVIDQGESKTAEFCNRAREIGRGAEVVEVQHPHHPHTPFGFHVFVGEDPKPAPAAWEPGPYRVVQPHEDESHGGMFLEIHDSHGRTAVVCGEPSDPMVQATARLLANAPQTFAALERLAQSAEERERSFRVDGFYPREVKDEVRAVVKVVRGL